MAPKASILAGSLLAAALALSACDDAQQSESTTQEKPAETTSAPTSASTAEHAAEKTETAAASGSEAAGGQQVEKRSASERAGLGDFDATGKIRCAEAAGQAMQQCDFGVAREGGGTAIVAISRPDGRKRFLTFENGTFVAADISRADGDITASATNESDLFKIEVGEERYELPEAVIFGG